MKLFATVLILIFGALPSLAADPSFPAEEGRWSNFGSEGHTISVVRYQTGLEGAVRIPADYQVCNGSQSADVTFETNDDGGNGSVLASGQCKCFEQPTALLFRSGSGRPVNGTYAAYAPGSSCRGPAAAIAEPVTRHLSCRNLFEPKQPVPGTDWHAVACDVPLPAGRGNYRICTAKDSITTTTGATYPITLAHLVANRKLAGRHWQGSTGQPLSEFFLMTGDCTDHYDVDYLSVLIWPFPVPGGGNDPFLVKSVELTVQAIGQETAK